MEAQLQSDIVLFQKRAESLIKGAPRVLILQRYAEKRIVAVQNPTMLLFDWLRSQDFNTCLRMVEAAVNCFCELAWIYGPFLINREMMRVTSAGDPICWIHHNFKMNLR